MRNRKKTEFKRLNPIQFKKLKAAFRFQMEKDPDFSDEEVHLFMEMVDRVGRDRVTQFLFVTGKVANMEISDEALKFADNAIEEYEAEKKIRRGR